MFHNQQHVGEQEQSIVHLQVGIIQQLAGELLASNIDVLMYAAARLHQMRNVANKFGLEGNQLLEIGLRLQRLVAFVGETTGDLEACFDLFQLVPQLCLGHLIVGVIDRPQS